MIGTEAARVRLGASTATDPGVLTRLAHDPSATVRASLALNPAAPEAANAVLAQDPDERVRALLARKLGALMPSLSAAERDALRTQTWALLTRLVADEAERVRAAVAEEVKHLPDAPRALILQLAHDRQITVAEPVILFSPLLAAEDLIALVASAPSTGTRPAIARRPNLPGAVSDAIVATADQEAIHALLCNQSAHIREATLDALAARSAEHESWQDPLVHRPLLSARAARVLSDIVAGRLLEALAARADLDDATRSRLRQRLTAQAPIQGPADPEDRTVSDRLASAVATGDLDGATRLLADLAGVPVAVVGQAVALRSTKGLVALAWQAGLPMGLAVGLQTLLPSVPPAAIIRPGPGDSFPLAVEEMKWQLDFLATAAQAEPAGQAWFSGGSGSRAPTR